MKAYSVTDKTERAYSTIVFAETRGKAKVIAQSTDECEDVPFMDIQALRVPEMDKYYRGLPELDWDNPEDRIALVNELGFHCSTEYTIDECDCDNCPATEWCIRYQDEQFKDDWRDEDRFTEWE